MGQPRLPRTLDYNLPRIIPKLPLHDEGRNHLLPLASKSHASLPIRWEGSFRRFPRPIFTQIRQTFNRMNTPRSWLLALLISLFTAPAAFGQQFATNRQLPSPDVHQGVAVDAEFFYAISNKAIAKHRKSSGELVMRWEASPDFPLIHMNHGVVHEGVLYIAHSNFPHKPATSSIELFDPDSLEHIDSHSFGIAQGSLTWIDFHNGSRFGVFAHYSHPKMSLTPDTDTSFTRLVQFDQDWQIRQSWVFPKELTDRWEPASNSGGSFGPDGRLYLSGHDAPELYVVDFPKAGSEMRFLGTWNAQIEGQAFAWDRSRPGYLFGILRKSGEVVELRAPQDLIPSQPPPREPRLPPHPVHE